DSVLPDDSVTIPAAPPAQTATTRASASTQAATPRATTPRQTAATPAATVDSMEPYYVDELPQGPPSLLPQLQMARRNTGAPSAEPLRALEDRSAGSVAPPRLSNREAVGTLLSERYPGDLRARGVGGTTIVTVLVAPDGTVRDSRLYTSSGNGRLDQVALGVTGRMRFSHPSSNATPEMVWVAVPLTFTPPCSRQNGYSPESISQVTGLRVAGP